MSDEIHACYTCAQRGEWGPYHAMVPGPTTGHDRWGPTRDRSKDKTLCGVQLTDMWERDKVEPYRIQCKRCRVMLERQGKLGKFMKLLPDRLRMELPPLGSQADVDNPIVYAKYFSGPWTWYPTEGNALYNDEGLSGLAQTRLSCVDRSQIENVMFFGFVQGTNDELGFFTLVHLKAMGADRDTYFKPKLLSEVRN